MNTEVEDMCLRNPQTGPDLCAVHFFWSTHRSEVEAGWRQDESRTGEKEPNAIRPVTEGEKRPRCSLNTRTLGMKIPMLGSPSMLYAVFPVPPNKTERYRKAERAGLGEQPKYGTRTDICISSFCAAQSPPVKKRCLANVPSVQTTTTRALWARSFLFFFQWSLSENIPDLFGSVAELAAGDTGTKTVVTDTDGFILKRVCEVVVSLGHGTDEDGDTLIGVQRL